MRGTTQYNLQGNGPIHHRHIIHSAFSAQMMQGRNFDRLFVLDLIKGWNMAWKQEILPAILNLKIPCLCCQHGPEVLNMLITTLWNQMSYPNLIFSKFTVSNWDKNHIDVYLSSHFKTSLLGQQKIAPAAAPSRRTLEKSLRLHKMMCFQSPSCSFWLCLHWTSFTIFHNE